MELPPPDRPGSNTFRILIATDNHLGYKEVSPGTVCPPSFAKFELRLICTDDIQLLGGPVWCQFFSQNDPILKDDSFNAFEEILQIAVDNNVDFLLLGGDLFHENKPSRQCIYRVR